MNERADLADGPNHEQARYWNEEGGPSWVRHEQRYESMLRPFDDALLTALDPRAGERFLDIGCGFGATSLAIAARGAEVHGVDISAPMIERARERAATTDVTVAFDLCDAQEDDLGGPHDAMVSRFGVMFFVDPIRAFTNIASAVTPDGRLAFTCWQPLDRNPWLELPIEIVRSFDSDALSPTARSAPTSGTGVPGAPNPLAFGDPDHVAHVLTSAGWSDVGFEPVEPLLHVGGDDGIDGAVELALNGSSVKVLIANRPPDLRERVRDALVDRFAEFVVDGSVRMQSAAWLVTARRESRP